MEDKPHAWVAYHASSEASPPAPIRSASPAFRPLDPEEYERQRAAELCPHRDCVGCGCSGCRCLSTGRRPGEIVNILACLECVTAHEKGATEAAPVSAT